MRARTVVSLLAFACGLSPALADGQQLHIVPGLVRPGETQFMVGLRLSTEVQSLGSLPGISFRLCWDQPEVVFLETSGIAPAPANGDRALGTEVSIQACDQSILAQGIPMLWSDSTAGWPDTNDLELAAVSLEVPDEYVGIVRLWIEEVAVGPGVTLVSNSAEVRFLGDEIFRDQFNSTPL